MQRKNGERKREIEKKECIESASCRDRIIKNFSLGHNKRASSFAIVDKIIKKSFNQFFFRGSSSHCPFRESHSEKREALRHGIFAVFTP